MLIRLPRTVGALLSIVVMTVACHHDSGTSPPPIFTCVDPIAGLLVYVTDASTGQSALQNATVIATLSSIYADTGRFVIDGALWVGFHSGTYRLTVTKPGYTPWAMDNVVVPAAPPPCEGNPAAQISIHAALVPSK